MSFSVIVKIGDKASLLDALDRDCVTVVHHEMSGSGGDPAIERTKAANAIALFAGPQCVYCGGYTCGSAWVREEDARTHGFGGAMHENCLRYETLRQRHLKSE